MKNLQFFLMYNKTRWSYSWLNVHSSSLCSQRKKKPSKHKCFAAYTKDTLLMHLLALPVEGVCSFILWRKLLNGCDIFQTSHHYNWIWMWNLERQGERGKKLCKIIVSISLPFSHLHTVVSFQVKVFALCSLERDTAVTSDAQILLNQPEARWNTQAALVKKV